MSSDTRFVSVSEPLVSIPYNREPKSLPESCGLRPTRPLQAVIEATIRAVASEYLFRLIARTVRATGSYAPLDDTYLTAPSDRLRHGQRLSCSWQHRLTYERTPALATATVRSHEEAQRALDAFSGSFSRDARPSPDHYPLIESTKVYYIGDR